MQSGRRIDTVDDETVVDVRIKIAGLWTSTMFVFAYVDIFSFSFRADVLNGALAGTVSIFTIDQVFFKSFVRVVARPRRDLGEAERLQLAPDRGLVERDSGPPRQVTTVYILLSSLMVYLSLTLPAKINRWSNVILAMLYAVSIAASCIGETWYYYFLGSFVEIILLLVLIRHAWRWR